MRICLVSPSLAGGGAERMVAVLANEFAATGHEAHVCLLSSEPADYSLSSEIPIACIPSRSARGLLAKVFANLRRVRTLRSYLRSTEPDAILAVQTSANLVSVLAGSGVARVYVSEQIDPRVHRPTWARRMVRRLTYLKAHRVCAPSEGVARALRRELWQWRRETLVVPNPVDEEFFRASVRGHRDWPVVAMGRLVPQKGFDLLLEALARIPATRRPQTQIFGEGPERSALEQYALELGLADTVAFPGFTDDAAGALGRAAVFVLPSRFEGFGNVVAEALAAGATVVAFDCPSGPAEILADGEHGLLVPMGDVGQLARRLEDALTPTAHPKPLRAAADRYRVSPIARNWLEIFRT